MKTQKEEKMYICNKRHGIYYYSQFKTVQDAIQAASELVSGSWEDIETTILSNYRRDERRSLQRDPLLLQIDRELGNVRTMPTHPVIALTEAGHEALLSEVGFDWLSGMSESMAYDDHSKVLANHRNQPQIVWLQRAAGRNLIVKFTSFKRYCEAYPSAQTRMHVSQPNFLERMGQNETIVKALQEWPKKSYDLGSPVEYAASRDFHVLEYAEGVSLEVLKRSVRDCREVGMIPAEGESAALTLFPRLVQEILHLQSVAWILSQNGVISRHDLSDENLLVSFDQKSMKFKVTLISQGVRSPALDSSDYYLRLLTEDSFKEDVKKEYQKQWRHLSRLGADYVAFLEKYCAPVQDLDPAVV